MEVHPTKLAELWVGGFHNTIRRQVRCRIIIPTEGVLVVRLGFTLYSPLGYEELTDPKWRALPWEKSLLKPIIVRSLGVN
jgi:hypothetical protein